MVPGERADVCQTTGDYRLYQEEDGWWYLMYKVRDVVGHHRLEMDNVVTEETWVILIKFQEVQRELEDFQEKTDEYQSEDSEGMLKKLPIVIQKVYNLIFFLNLALAFIVFCVRPRMEGVSIV